MPQCCLCSNRGRCQNCSFVKNGRLCSNCLPNRIEKCMNQRKDSERDQESFAPTLTDQHPSPDDLFHDSQPSYDLPAFVPLPKPDFRWSDSVDGPTFIELVNRAYKEVVHWKQNISVPSGKAGRAFVFELSRMFRAYGESNAMNVVALTAAMVFPALLQKPHSKAKVKEHI